MRKLATPLAWSLFSVAIVWALCSLALGFQWQFLLAGISAIAAALQLSWRSEKKALPVPPVGRGAGNLDQPGPLQNGSGELSRITVDETFPLAQGRMGSSRGQGAVNAAASPLFKGGTAPNPGEIGAAHRLKTTTADDFTASFGNPELGPVLERQPVQ